MAVEFIELKVHKQFSLISQIDSFLALKKIIRKEKENYGQTNFAIVAFLIHRVFHSHD
jgi:hypothetical protein